jgi:hypothetical protein
MPGISGTVIILFKSSTQEEVNTYFKGYGDMFKYFYPREKLYNTERGLI